MKYISLLFVLLVITGCEEKKADSFSVKLSDGTVLSTTLEESEQVLESQQTSNNVHIAANDHYYINEVRIPFNFLEDELAPLIRDAKNKKVVISIDKEVPAQQLVKVADIVSKLKGKSVIAVTPN